MRTPQEEPQMQLQYRRSFVKLASAALAASLLVAAPWAWASDEAPDAMIQRLSNEVLQILKTDKGVQSGDADRAMAVVDSKIMPHVNFTRMTASAVGPGWRKASPEQRQRLQHEFKTLLVHTYAGALKQVGDRTVEVLPLRGSPSDKEVIVRTLVKGKGDPIQLDYRLEKAPGQGGGWKIYDLNVLGVWLVENYRPQFAQEIHTAGVDGLIGALAARNKTNASNGKG